MTSFATSRDGTRIAYWTSGSGPVVLIVHGAGGDHTPWAPLINALSSACTVVTFDRRGRGRSRDTLPYAGEREVEDVVMLAERLRPACLLGHSFGGFLALEAARVSSAIRSVIVYEGWPDPSDDMTVMPEWLPELEALAVAGRRAEIVEYGESAATIEELHRSFRWQELLGGALVVPREIRAYSAFWGADPVGEARWHDLAIPVLLLYGEKNVDQGQAAVALAATLSDAKIEMLPGQGHRAHYEGPEVLASAVGTFVRGLPVASP
ncbi:MAG: alpha/beta hydrolase [Chloroflexi bacterium]|nr:MAG: alpha/beta hydrolase [Chloroflexota bacterium]